MLTSGQALHGFVYSNGVWTTLDDPKGVSGNGYGTALRGIDDFGRIVGGYYDPTTYEQTAFVYAGGDFTPLHSADNNLAFGINNLGRVVGISYDLDVEAFAAETSRARSRSAPPAR